MGAGAAAANPQRTHQPHTDDKSFVCPVCQRVFNKKANLKVHSRKHTGEKPYVCSKPGCGRAFMWKSSVTFHEQNCPTMKRAELQKDGVKMDKTGTSVKRTKSANVGARKRHKSLTTPSAPAGLREGKKVDNEGMLPAAATLLGEKRTMGRPPMMPGVRGLYQGGKETSGKMLFDLRVPATSGFAKMMKMPIAMELDDSDDEASHKIVGAQDAFMTTGNPFVGFAPPTRCSPLPISSPIVPGISPMPLSPLAPFSPLPPDSPAHNAPNPVHPPVHTPGTRPHTPGTSGAW